MPISDRPGAGPVIGVVVGPLVVAGNAGLGATYLLRADALSQSRGTQADVASRLPAAVDAGPTVSYLAGAGSALLVGHRSAIHQLGAGSADGSCQVWAAAVQVVLAADEAYRLVAGVPDEPLRAVLADERVALGRTFTRCADPALPDGSTDLAGAVALADPRLVALAVPT